MRIRKLTDAQVGQIRTIIAARRALPTCAQLAQRFGISKSLVDQIGAGVYYKIPREPTTNVQDVLVALGLTKP